MNSVHLLLAGLLVGSTFLAAMGKGYDPWYVFVLAVALGLSLIADGIIFEDKRRR